MGPGIPAGMGTEGVGGCSYIRGGQEVNGLNGLNELNAESKSKR
jgi:hypothetical protein